MEKIVTLLWRPQHTGRQAFAEQLLQRAPQLQAIGARGLKICVHDDDTAAGDALHMSPGGAPKAAMVSYWLDMAQARGEIESLLQQGSESLASFLVVESVPTANEAHRPEPGKRNPGFTQVTCIRARQDMSYEDFIEFWQTEHMACAIETQSTFQYIRNEIVRPLSGQAAPWSAIVEESFPAEAMSNPQAFYDAVGDEEKFQANLQRMIATVTQFLDMDALDVTAMSEYVFDRI